MPLRTMAVFAIFKLRNLWIHERIEYEEYQTRASKIRNRFYPGTPTAP